MTFEELNIVRTLKKKIADEEQKLQGFRDLAQSITPQATRVTYREGKKEISYTCLDAQPKGSSKDSRVEMTVALIVDTEKIIADLKMQLEKETPLLIKKFQAEFPDGIEQRILISRYVAGQSFREIARSMRYSLQHVFRVHKKILKNLDQKRRVEESSGELMRYCVNTCQCDILNLQKLCTEKLHKGLDVND